MTRLDLDENAPQTAPLCGAFVEPEPARAKVNLSLEILGRRPDGYHALSSLVVFADYADTLSLDPEEPFSLSIDGPFATALSGSNLVQAAAALYAQASVGKQPAVLGSDTNAQSHFASEGTTGGAAHARCGVGGHEPARGWARAQDDPAQENTVGGRNDTQASRGNKPIAASEQATDPIRPSGAFRLTKRIPVAAGLGGGSADAAAALRLLARVSIGSPRLSELMALGAQLGADVPACLFSKAAIMTGIGERLRHLDPFPPVPAVLVNPRMPLSTVAVFHALGAPPLGVRGDTDVPTAFGSIDAVLDYAASRRNDLEAPARRLLPIVGAMLDRLTQCPGALLVRLSGSGPTCFALFRSPNEAEAAAKSLRTDRPEWWIEATVLS